MEELLTQFDHFIAIIKQSKGSPNIQEYNGKRKRIFDRIISTSPNESNN